MYCITKQCQGHHGYDLTSFSVMYELEDGSGYSKEYLTNAELLEKLNPRSYRMPYIYDNFDWDHCKTYYGYDFLAGAAAAEAARIEGQQTTTSGGAANDDGADDAAAAVSGGGDSGGGGGGGGGGVKRLHLPARMAAARRLRTLRRRAPSSGADGGDAPSSGAPSSGTDGGDAPASGAPSSGNRR